MKGAATRTTTHVTELNEIDDLRLFGPLWRSLTRPMADVSFVQSLEFLRAAWSVLGEGRRLRVVLVHEHGEVVCVLPLACFASGASVAGLRQVTHAVPEFGLWSAPVGPASVTAVKLALQHLTGSARDWDVLELTDWADAVAGPSVLET
ncbi:MAG TPA: hypothetical protein EYP14_06410, partial [Planctomycetaceae bacterium]|nr:hypothetical protein [Planctomycetaceae bacterium]